MDDRSALPLVSITVTVYDTVNSTVLRHFRNRRHCQRSEAARVGELYIVPSYNPTIT